jgi:3-oxoacyl-[acyl-carrier-protein] synthase-3
VDLWELLRGLDTPRTPAVVVNGNGCGNLALALGVACNSVRAEEGHSGVLIVVADRLDDPDERYQPNGQTILSDGAASCLVGTQVPTAGFRLLGISVRQRADFDHGAVPSMAGVRVVMAGVEEAVEDLRTKMQSTEDDTPAYSRLVTGNYGVSTRGFLALAAGMDTADDYAPHASDVGHCFAADLLVNLATLQEHKEVRPGERLLLLATSSRSWSAMAVEYVTA